METKNKNQSAMFIQYSFLQNLVFRKFNLIRQKNFAHSLLLKKSGAGFTLIELLVVIAIIGLLASVILVSLNNTRSKARDVKRVADLNQFAKALELYFNANFSYPTLTTSGALSTLTGAPALVPTYLSNLPVAPNPADGTCSSAATNGANAYYMYANSSGAGQPVTSAYAITFCLGNTTGSLSAGPHTLTQSGFQ
jgi:prepilin-type N-terminal cleavage/methylation domain-containing protein